MPVQGNRAPRVQRAVVVAIDIHFGRDAGTRLSRQQHDVDDLRSATHVQIAGRATNNFNVLHLAGRDAGQLSITFIFLAGDTAAVDQYLVTTGAQTTTIGATGAAWTATAAPAGTLIAAAHRQIDARDAGEHVIDGKGFVLGKEFGGIGNGGITGCRLLC